MKKIFFFLFCIVSSYVVTGQEVNNELLEVKVIPPKFVPEASQPSSTAALYAFVRHHFSYNTPELINFGTAVIRFTVTENGQVENFQVTNSVSWEVDKALQYALKQTSGMWLPGSNNGKPVAMEQEITMKVVTGLSEKALEKMDFDARGKDKFQRGNELLFDKNAPRRALHKFNYVVRLLPKEKNTYYLRGLCYHKLGQNEKAEKDWEYYRELGGLDMQLSNYP